MEELTDIVTDLIGLGTRNTSMTSCISSARRRNEEQRARNRLRRMLLRRIVEDQERSQSEATLNVAIILTGLCE